MEPRTTDRRLMVTAPSDRMASSLDPAAISTNSALSSLAFASSDPTPSLASLRKAPPDIAPSPCGKSDPWAVYKWVGKCLSEWAHVECALSRLYAELRNAPMNEAAYRRYNAPALFQDRLAQIERAADQFFVEFPSPVTQGKLADLISTLEAHSRMRDEIASGTVVALSNEGPRAYDAADRIYMLVDRYHGLNDGDGEQTLRFIHSERELERFSLTCFGLGLSVARTRNEIAAVRGRALRSSR